MSDWQEAGEVREGDARKDSTDTRLTQEGRNSMQGPPDAAAPGAPPDNGDDNGDDDGVGAVPDASERTYPDQRYTDAKGNDLTMRTYPSGDGYYVRVFDGSKTPEPPERSSYGDAGRANLHLERDTDGNMERAKLQDVFTEPQYRQAGTGGRMLSQCEEIARQNGAGEIHGVLDCEDEREWYLNRGYGFRGTANRELYKQLQTDSPYVEACRCPRSSSQIQRSRQPMRLAGDWSRW